MAKTLIVDATQVRADLLDYLRAPGFTYFQLADVANYAALSQVCVKLTYGACESCLVFDCAAAQLTSYDQCTDGSAGADRESAYWAEVEAISAEFAAIATTNSTVQIIRRRDPSLASPY